MKNDLILLLSVIKEREDEIREEILKILKETGLNENFVINFDELTIKGKIGEGGNFDHLWQNITIPH